MVIANGRVGRMWGGRVAVAIDDNEILARGEGEILVQTPALMSGYFMRADLTAEVIRGGWYYTGDRGIVDASGVIGAHRPYQRRDQSCGIEDPARRNRSAARKPSRSRGSLRLWYRGSDSR